MEHPMQQIQADIPWKEWLIKAGGAGLIAAVASAVFLKNENVPVFGMSIPSAALNGAVVATASIGADLAHQYVLPLIPHNDKYAQFESVGLAIAASGGGTYVVGKFLGEPALLPAFALGAASFVASDYLYHNLPMSK